ncbi:glypican-5-like [Macrobrachium nipponense]|uniref:glypican-5-like n=1 Tax=Macrobrachium nipponense TaxID=159736 RepID=UPI0030C8B480
MAGQARKLSFVQGVVEEALTNSEHRAIKEFQNTYPRLAPSAKQVLHDLYSGLREGLTDFEDERALERPLESFWDNLFPPVYHSALHARMPPFSKAYTECLRDAQRIVQPWGIIPTLVGEPLLRGLQSARLLLHALDVGADVVNTARNLPVPQECGEAAARLQYCGACHGASAPPCLGLCLNVARGCLAPLAEVDGAWSDLAGAVGRVHESLEAMGLSRLLHQLPEKLSEAVMVALERGPKLQKKIPEPTLISRYENPSFSSNPEPTLLSRFQKPTPPSRFKIALSFPYSRTHYPFQISRVWNYCFTFLSFNSSNLDRGLSLWKEMLDSVSVFNSE